MLCRLLVVEQAAAAALKMTGAELLKIGIADEIIPEPLGGAHRDVDTVSQAVAQTLHTQLSQLLATSTEQLLANRYEKFRQMAAIANV